MKCSKCGSDFLQCDCSLPSRVTTPDKVRALCGQQEWFVRDPVTGNFVHADPPVQFTTAELMKLAEEKAGDKAEIARLSAEKVELREALQELADAGAEAWGEERPCVRIARAALSKGKSSTNEETLK